MKRLLFGAALLLVLLALGLWIADAMSDTHQQLADTLEQAADQALTGTMEDGVALARQAQQRWQSLWHGVASVADHAPMDEIDGLFAQLEVYAKTGFREAFAAVCARLSQLIEAMGEAHALSWYNFL